MFLRCYSQQPKGRPCPVSIGWWMDKWTVAQADNGTLFSCKKEWSPEIWMWMKSVWMKSET